MARPASCPTRHIARDSWTRADANAIQSIFVLLQKKTGRPASLVFDKFNLHLGKLLPFIVVLRSLARIHFYLRVKPSVLRSAPGRQESEQTNVW